MPDEKALRKPGFDEENSVPLTCDDGQSWYFPKPWLDFRRVPVPGGRPTFRVGRSFGRDFDAKREAVRVAETLKDQADALFDLAEDMLGRNYHLIPEDFPSILAFRPDDPANVQFWQDVSDVATGNMGDVEMGDRSDPKAGTDT